MIVLHEDAASGLRLLLLPSRQYAIEERSSRGWQIWTQTYRNLGVAATTYRRATGLRNLKLRSQTT